MNKINKKLFKIMYMHREHRSSQNIIKRRHPQLQTSNCSSIYLKMKTSLCNQCISSGLLYGQDLFNHII